ncbi:MAG: hypothetical protein OXG85_10125 [Chloroflexi bacterium]|nr:hypothetical protein [Chloroflexota bacterium]
MDDDPSSAGEDKRSAARRLAKQLPGDSLLQIKFRRLGTRLEVSCESALQNLKREPAPDLIVVSSNEILPQVVDFVEGDSSEPLGPPILCLAVTDPTPVSESASIVSLEFPMIGVAKDIVVQIDAWMNDEPVRRETVRMQPILNLSHR